MSVVLVEGRSWEDGDPMPGPLATYIALFNKHGFDVRPGYAESFEEGGEYGEKAQKAGEKKPDQHLRTVWLDAYDGTNFATIAYQYVNDRETPVCNLRMWNLVLEKLSDAELKQRIKNANASD